MKHKLPLMVTVLSQYSLTTIISFLVSWGCTYGCYIEKYNIENENKIGIEDLVFTLAEYLNVCFSEIISIS